MTYFISKTSTKMNMTGQKANTIIHKIYILLPAITSGSLVCLYVCTIFSSFVRVPIWTKDQSRVSYLGVRLGFFLLTLLVVVILNWSTSQLFELAKIINKFLFSFSKVPNKTFSCLQMNVMVLHTCRKSRRYLCMVNILLNLVFNTKFLVRISNYILRAYWCNSSSAMTLSWGWMYQMA